MKINVKDASVIIKDLESKFSSHEFIKKYALHHEKDYIDELYSARNKNHPFQIIHSNIGAFLEKHSQILHIQKSNRGFSENIFGNNTEVQFWDKV